MNEINNATDTMNMPRVEPQDGLPRATLEALAAIQQQVPQRLADKLSDLLDDAVDDAERIEAVDGITFDMSHWVTLEADEHAGMPQPRVCSVCLAGSTMLCRLNVADTLVKRASELPSFWNVHVKPHDMAAQDIRSKLRAINAMRTGDFNEAWYELWPEKECPPEVERLAAACHRTYQLSDIAEATERLSWDTYREWAATLRELGH